MLINMKIIKYTFLILVSAVLYSCADSARTTDTSVNLSERETYRYNKALTALQEVESLGRKASISPTHEVVIELLTKAENLKYDYNNEGMNVATMMHCDSLVMRINNYKKQVEQFAENTILQLILNYF